MIFFVAIIYDVHIIKWEGIICIMIVIQILKKRKRIEEEKNKCKKCYIQGPTGPKGEIGPTGSRGENVFSNVNVGEKKRRSKYKCNGGKCWHK